MTSKGYSTTILPAWFVNASVSRLLAEKPPATKRRIGPNDTIQIAVIGTSGNRGGYRQGLHDAQTISRKPGVKCLAACDVDGQHLAEARTALGKDCKGYADFREVLARPDIDAVVIGTPDHWHSCIANWAIKAGKDVYCEKPLTLRIDEGKILVKNARKYNTIFQVGSQQRSNNRFRMACELVRNGRIGKVTKVIAHLPNGTKGGPFDVKPVPTDFNWDMWLGPAPATEYIKERTHGTFRHWYEYSGGMMTDWGAHHLDIAQWGLGRDGSGPVKISSKASLPKFNPHSYNALYDFEVTYTYDDGVTLIATNQGENGVEFIGEEGWIFVSRTRIGASDPELLLEPLKPDALKLYISQNHAENFTEGIRTRKRPICDVEVGHRSATVCHLGNISARLGNKTLQWDPQKEIFIGAYSKEANKLREFHYRKPWNLE
jgi:predicted dehydrogenase